MLTRWFLVLSLALVTACSVPESEEAPIGGDTDDGDTAQMEASPLFVQVTSKYENSDLSTIQGSCYLDATTVFPSTKTCTIRIPELQLYYSDLIFRMGTASTETCAQVSFTPYYYRKSTSANFLPSAGAEELDCTDATVKGCWGGAGPAMFDNFPSVNGSYFLPSIMTEASYTLKSSNSRYIADVEDSSLATNVGSTNNLIDRASAVGSPAYIGGGAYQDYEFVCADKWGEMLYGITITIADDDTEATLTTPGSDSFFDWGGL